MMEIKAPTTEAIRAQMFSATLFIGAKTENILQGPGAHVCNPSYSRGRDQENYGLKSPRAK
jgi:hypothetical protein